MATTPCAEASNPPSTTIPTVNPENISKMDKKSFLQAGHTPTLLAAFLYFDLAFMVWVLLGPLGIGIAKDLGLSHAEKGRDHRAGRGHRYHALRLAGRCPFLR